MCSECPVWALTQAEDWLPLIWLVLQQQSNRRAFSIWLMVSVSVLQARHQKIKCLGVRVLHWLCWKCKCSCVLSRLRNKSSRFCKISSVLNKIMLKILWLCFFLWTQCRMQCRMHIVIQDSYYGLWIVTHIQAFKWYHFSHLEWSLIYSSRSRYYLTSNILKVAQDRAILTITDQ